MAAKKTTKKSATKKSTTKKSQKNTTAQNKRGLSPQTKAILLCAVAVLLFCIAVIRGENENIWYHIHQFFLGTFGVCFILVPFIFLYLGILTAKEKEMAHKGVKITFSVLIVVFISTLIYVFSEVALKNETMDFFKALGNTYLRTIIPPVTTGSGLIGCILGYPLYTFIGMVPTVIVLIIATIVSFMLLTGITLVDIGNVAKKQVNRVKERHNERVRIREEQSNFDDEDAMDTTHMTSRKRRILLKRDDSRIDIPLDTDNKRRKKSQNAVAISSELDPDNEADQEIINIINQANNGIKEDSELSATDVAKRITSKKNSNNYSDGAKVADPETAPIPETVDLEKETKSVEKQINKRKKSTSKYKYPLLKLLDNSFDDDNGDAYDEMQNNANKLIETLQSFNVKANIINISRGPSVTRYELQPAPGVKISKITNLADDIALSLAASGVRIEAPIPGKAAVGIEVPNRIKSSVSLRELIGSKEFKDAESKLTCVLGRDISGGIVLTDLAKLPHLLIAGTTGSGKSVCVNSLLMSILYKASPEEVKLLLIDPKMVEFSKYKGIPHLLVPVVSDVKKAAGALNWAVSEMLNRYKMFSEYDCKDIASYNQLIERNLEYIAENGGEITDSDDEENENPCLEVRGLKVPTEKMCQIVVAIDELADLMMVAPAEVEEAICRLAQMARAAGMHLIIATQRPSVNVITGVIKANIPSRIALKVSSSIDSRTILDASGAEKLIGRGDMLYMPVGANKALRVQGCFARDEEIENVTDYIKNNYDADYDEEVEQTIRKITAEGIGSSKKGQDTSADTDSGDVDVLMEKAIEVVVEAGQASTSLLQRRLKVGYARAGRMIDDMEQMGIVGPHQGSKARDVLMTHQEWLERNNAFGVPVDESDD